MMIAAFAAGVVIGVVACYAVGHLALFQRRRKTPPMYRSTYRTTR